jgi:adenosylcobinamide-GDP ribazoletransferase
MKIKIWFDGVILAFQLLSTIPITKQVEWDDQRARASVAAYPLVGLLLGFFLALQWFIIIHFTPLSPMIAVMWLLSFSVIFSGGLHLDGWTDFHDAVFSRRSRERKLDIMKDPRVGTFGVISLLFVMGWRFVFLLELIQNSNIILFGVLFIPLLVRLLVGWQLLLGTFAREEGMVVALKAAKGKEMKLFYSCWSIASCFVLIILSPVLLWLIVAAVAFLIFWQKWVVYQLGGITGDTIGAGAEGGETLLWGILWSLLLLDMV